MKLNQMEKTIKQEFTEELKNHRTMVQDKLYGILKHMDTATFLAIHELLCDYASAEWREGYISGLEFYGYGKNDELMRRLLEDLKKKKESRYAK